MSEPYINLHTPSSIPPDSLGHVLYLVYVRMPHVHVPQEPQVRSERHTHTQHGLPSLQRRRSAPRCKVNHDRPSRGPGRNDGRRGKGVGCVCESGAGDVAAHTHSLSLRRRRRRGENTQILAHTDIWGGQKMRQSMWHRSKHLSVYLPYLVGQNKLPATPQPGGYTVASRPVREEEGKEERGPGRVTEN